jgi:riboflavin kinase/FMN adenylyltransferase
MVIAATGFFDGVHLGHQAVLARLCREAQAIGLPAMVVTFWPHPRTVLQSDAPKFRLLNALDEKRELLLSYGVDKVTVLSFTPEFSQMGTEAFLRDCLQAQYGVKKLIAGYDHHLGHVGPEGSLRLEAAAEAVGLPLVRVAENLCDGKVVSATKIRETISQGNMEQAKRWLGYDYALQGVVVEGQRLGRTLGYPTANMRLYEPLKQLPADGVYAVRLSCLSHDYYGMMNIGFRPTVSQFPERSIETHIFDFDKDIYGVPMVVYPLFRLRGEQAFGSLEALKQQLFEDKAACLEWISQYKNQ